jgi:hypothetical protein
MSSGAAILQLQRLVLDVRETAGPRDVAAPIHDVPTNAVWHLPAWAGARLARGAGGRTARSNAVPPPTPIVQRQEDPNEAGGDEHQWKRWDGDRFIRNVESDLKQFDDFKASPQSGQQLDDIGIDASIKLFLDPLGGNEHRMFKDFKGFATRKLGDAGIQKINQLLAISNGQRRQSANEVFNGVQYRDPGHQYTMKLASEEGSLLDELKAKFTGDGSIAAKLLGTEVTVSYQNALGPEWNYEKKLDIAGLKYGISVDLGPGLGDVAKKSAKDLLGGQEEWSELVEVFTLAKWQNGIRSALAAAIKGGWSFVKLIWKFPRASWEIVKASFKENFNPDKIKEEIGKNLEPGFGRLKIKIGHEGVRADRTYRYWGPEDLNGPVTGMRLLNAGIATPVGEAEYKGIDALELLGNKGWSENLSFPQLGEGETKLENQLNAKIEVTLGEISGGYAASR